MDYYRRLIAFSADWGFNALVFRLADDQGAAIRFESHPEFFTHKNALTAAQVRELVAYGQQRGVELIPEIESFGHTKFITASSNMPISRTTTPTMWTRGVPLSAA